VLREFRRINDAVWERYRRGLISQPSLARERFRQLLVQLDADPRGGRALGASYLDQLARRGDLLPGCRRALRRLERRYRLGIVTNGIDRVQRSRLRAAGLERHFSVIVTSQSCGFAKPDPRIFGAALSTLGLRPRQVLYVGDDAGVDGAAAAAAGIPFVWIDRGVPLARGVRRPRRRVVSLSQLAQALQGI
jgi:HAD superfamily hydrolase (TIGR01509 family)